MTSVNQIQEQSFADLPMYLKNLKGTNPHSFTGIKKGPNDHFQLCYVAIGCVIHTFLSCMRPVIFLANIPLKVNSLKSMYLAIGIDGNNRPLPLAYGLGIKQTTDNWYWFLMKLNESLRNCTTVAFISTMSDCIDSSLSQAFPDSYQGYCCQYFYMKMRSMSRNNPLFMPLFWKTCKSYTMTIFDENFARLKQILSTQQRRWLQTQVVAKWARPYFPLSRFNIMTINLPNTSAMFSRDEGNVPIIFLLDAIREAIQLMFIQRMQLGGTLTGSVTPYVDGLIQKRLYQSRMWKATYFAPHTFEVTDAMKNFTVTLLNHTCTCGKWRPSGLPSVHAVTAAIANKDDCYGLVNIYWRADVYQVGYGTEMVNPLPPPPYWERPNDAMVVLPPAF